VGFEHTIPVLEGAKTVHALDRAAIVTGWLTKSKAKLVVMLCELTKHLNGDQ
jgi:hypothetical protein